MRANPTESWRASRRRTNRARTKEVRVHHGRDDDGPLSPALSIIRDDRVPADDHVRPIDQAIGLAKALQERGESSVGRAPISEISGVVEVEDDRLSPNELEDRFEPRGPQEHRLALDEDNIKRSRRPQREKATPTGR